MAHHPEALPAGPSSFAEFAHQIMERFAAAKASRISRRKDRAMAGKLQQMDPRLLDDIGVTFEERSSEVRPLAKLNPLVVAVNLYTIPRCGR